jgi:hypothetical protein
VSGPEATAKKKKKKKKKELVRHRALNKRRIAHFYHAMFVAKNDWYFFSSTIPIIPHLKLL